MIKTIYFRVDGDDGKFAGLGHIYRSLNFYTNLNKKLNKNHKFVFLSKYKEGIKILQEKTNKKVIKFSRKNLNRLNFNKNDVVIIDTLGAEKFLINKLNINKIKKISFDELNLKNFKSGIVINGILFTKKILKYKKNIKIYQGTNYLVLNKNFSKKKIFIDNKKVNLKNIFICSGGADHKGFLFKVSSYLSNFNNYKLNVVLGNAVKKTNKIFNLKHKKIIKKINVKNVKKQMEKNDIIICSGGTIMFEAIAAGFKPLVFENYSHQKYAIKYFSKKNQIINLGKLNIKNLKSLNDHIKKFNKSSLKENFKRNIKSIDGYGFSRINKILLKYINEK